MRPFSDQFYPKSELLQRYFIRMFFFSFLEISFKNAALSRLHPIVMGL